MKVTVLGLGRHGGGVGAARWLAAQGCRVTISDAAPAASLADSLEQLAEVPLARVSLGRHDEADVCGADLIIVNPAIRPEHPLLKLARQRGVACSSEIELLLRHCPARIVGVTGTAGKSTTCTLLAEMLRESGERTWLGGNLGGSLLADLPQMQPSDVVVLELSSFQLAHLSDAAPLPHLAVVTNCTPHHLEWHGSWPAYVAAKQRLLMGAGIRVVVNPDDAELARWTRSLHLQPLPLVNSSHVAELALPGAHNQINARLAATAAERLGATPQAVQQALRSFAGLPHRMQLVAEIAGRRFINDSKATSVSAARAALQTMEGNIWWIVGGAVHQADWNELARLAGPEVRGIAAMGAAGPMIDEALRQAGSTVSRNVCATVVDAVRWCFAQSQPGHTVLFSPACPSFDQFTDFAARGDCFTRAVHALATSGASFNRPT